MDSRADYLTFFNLIFLLFFVCFVFIFSLCVGMYIWCFVFIDNIIILETFIIDFYATLMTQSVLMGGSGREGTNSKEDLNVVTNSSWKH